MSTKNNRGLLRRQIKATWVETMRETYLTQTINSERALRLDPPNGE